MRCTMRASRGVDVATHAGHIRRNAVAIVAKAPSDPVHGVGQRLAPRRSPLRSQVLSGSRSEKKERRSRWASERGAPLQACALGCGLRHCLLHRPRIAEVQIWVTSTAAPPPCPPRSPLLTCSSATMSSLIWDVFPSGRKGSAPSPPATATALCPGPLPTASMRMRMPLLQWASPRPQLYATSLANWMPLSAMDAEGCRRLGWGTSFKPRERVGARGREVAKGQEGQRHHRVEHSHHVRVGDLVEDQYPDLQCGARERGWAGTAAVSREVTPPLPPPLHSLGSRGGPRPCRDLRCSLRTRCERR